MAPRTRKTQATATAKTRASAAKPAPQTAPKYTLLEPIFEVDGFRGGKGSDNVYHIIAPSGQEFTCPTIAGLSRIGRDLLKSGDKRGFLAIGEIAVALEEANARSSVADYSSLFDVTLVPGASLAPGRYIIRVDVTEAGETAVYSARKSDQKVK